MKKLLSFFFLRKSVVVLIIMLLMLTAIFFYGACIYPHNPTIPSGTSLEPPSPDHYLGTDNLGIDIFAQISHGFFMSMATGFAAASIAFILGGFLGVLAGYCGGILDHILSFIVNFFLSVPQMPVLIILGAFWGQSALNIMLIIALFSWAAIAKQIRARTMSVRGRAYIRLARSYGGTVPYIMRIHLLPELLPILSVNALAVIGKAILQESALAYLGLSDPINKSWGMMISRASAFSGIYFTDYWMWWLIPPVVALMLTILLTRLLARSLELRYMEGGI